MEILIGSILRVPRKKWELKYIKSYYMYSMTQLHALIHSVAVHTPNFRDKEKYKHATVNTTNLPQRAQENLDYFQCMC